MASQEPMASKVAAVLLTKECQNRMLEGNRARREKQEKEVCTLTPESETRSPRPEARNPKPETRSRKPES